MPRGASYHRCANRTPVTKTERQSNEHSEHHARPVGPHRMTVNQTATKAGKRYERELLDFFRAKGLDAERLRLAGVADEGDLVLAHPDGINRIVVEAKRQRSLNLSGWIKEAKVERDHYHKQRDLLYSPGFVVVHHARSKSTSESYVTTTLSEWLRWLR